MASPPTSPTLSRPTPRRGFVPVPGGNIRSPSTTPSLEMGVPGVSAFTPYALMSPPQPPNPTRPTPRRGAVPVPGGNRSPPTCTSSPPCLEMGVPGVSAFTPFVTARARALTSPPPQQHQPPQQQNVFGCSMCDKEFPTGKALFGHMRSHPGRGWKGARPPPAFNASEEFADLVPLLHPPPPPVPDHTEAPLEPEPPAPRGDASDGGDTAMEGEPDS